jgi:hypothetical protein
MRTRTRGRRFIWHAMPVEGGARSAEAAEALQWLGRRLAFEQWFEDLRSPKPARRSAA